MRTILCALLLCVLSLPLVAAMPEDGKVACEDGIDNDADGLIDCDDSICHGSSRSCPLPQKAFVAGLGEERGRPDFDAAMVTIGGTPPGQDLLLVDLDGGAPRFDDLIAGRPGDLAVFPNIRTTGKASLPQQPLSQPVQANSRIAGGDFSGDGRADVVAVNSTRMQRYRGNGAGGFDAEGPPVNAVPGPAGGLPAIAGPTIAIANSRLRIYDSCTVQPPDFPATTETFAASGLCASVAFPVSGTAEVITGFIGPAGVSRFAVVVGPSVQIYEIVRTTTQAGTMVNAVRIGAMTTTPFFVNDVAYSTSEDVLIAALSNGRLQARRGDGTVASSLNSTLALRTVTPPEQITRLAIGPLLDGRPTVVAVEQKGEALHVVPFSRNGGWRQREVVTKAWDTEPTILRRAGDIVVGQFNDDFLLDVAVLDAETGNVVMLRQTPHPCATFITSASHGLVLSEDDVPSQEYLQPFSRAINDEVIQINSSRRPANGFRDVAKAPEAQCPIRHIEVRGHWERDALPDLAYIGRGGWIGSMWVPAPSCHLVPMLPAFTPWDFWVSAYFLLLPNYMPSDAICIADFPIYSDPLTRLRFFVAGIGQGAETLARNWTSQGSRRAASNINAAVREAITDADAEMDACSGHIYVDIAAHSRGSAVNSDMLSKGFGKRANYNFDVSFTLVDGIDPSPKDNMRPHVRAGYIMGDPKIARRGSEWISSFHTGSSQGTSIDGLLDLVPPWTLVDDEYRATEVVGLPVGRDRRAELEDIRRTFGAFEGPLGDLVHVEAMEHASGYAFVNPATLPSNNIHEPSAAARPDGPSFAFISTTLLGRVMQNPRMDLPFDAVGFHTRSSFNNDDERRCLPDACGGTGNCQDEVGASVEVLGQNSRALTARELVHDGDFRLRTGIVRNARDLVSEHGDLKAALPGSKFLQLREYILATASALYPAGGRWTRTGAVTLPATGPNMAEGIRTFVAWPGVDYNQLDSSSEVEAELLRWKSELGELTAPGSRDKVNALAAATARGNDGTEAYAQFPSNAVGRLWQDLDIASRVHNRFLVRVEYELSSAAAGASMLSVQLKGAGVSHSEHLTTATGMGRRVAEFTVERSITPPGGDIRFLLSGKHLRVYSVSVRPFFPVRSSVTGLDYELVLFDEGVTWPTAKQLASRHVYRGRRGRLAHIVSTTQLNDLAGMLKSDVAAWVDGSSANGAPGSFRDSAGATLSNSLFRSDTGFSEPRPRGAYAFAWPARLGMRLGHSPPAVSVEDTPMGFLVEYPAH